ncbi:putative prenyl protein specific carboxyl methyltransferase [Trypanosoma theileri]|uniref:Protein-S-isoprenylcysteine O-methyltransferase n=1 Tax=Trypanosoma theileri TaxID=67003 RepID=A0A1X0P5F1_9TRYP|nr:putative prenyl protein specific carboxyl methyltransferase [Trypanosoma theileri]ORC92162.1 putative prenyl protein specific carboxyl methyltransferase [Trypanosoma theileri]
MNLDRQLKRNLVREIALIAFFLGATFMFGVTLILHSLFYTKSVGEYAAGVYIISTMVLFHMCEFLVAASLRRHDTHPDTFMLYHSKEYILATTAAWVEFLVEWLFIPESWKISLDSPWSWLLRLNYTTVTIAAVLTVVFYFVRVGGMLHCGSNFSLIIEHERRSNHVLVEDGIYAVLRHPAYFGFFWRTVCSQLLLANPICLVLHTVVTWVFFAKRIPYEEELLSSEEFFGDRYKAYKVRTWVGIPFIH